MELSEPTSRPLTFYGAPSDTPTAEWTWVDGELEAAGTYWVVPRSVRHPHPRPVWGVWADRRLHLSIGSPIVSRQLDADPLVTVHLDSGTDVVIVEGAVTGTTSDSALIGRYDAKYDWTYVVDEYGPLTTIAPTAVIAWRSAGWAGRDGFQAAGRWQLA